MRMMVLANDLGEVGMPAAARALEAGCPALDGIEQGIRRVEADSTVRHVGLGGDPNLLGEMECDAAVMNGADCTAGSVGALKGYVHAVSVARAVMERLPHVMLVGDGAARFAAEIGEPRAEMLTDEARAAYGAWLAREIPEDERTRWPDVPLAHHAWSTARRIASRDTVIFLAIDRAGNLAAGTSTSGWSYKYPGRLGDSPIIGAGLYAHNQHGACGCTHTGEMTIRAATAVSVVRSMERGATVREACHEAAGDLRDLRNGLRGQVAIHAIDRTGEQCVLSVAPNGPPPAYWVWTEGAAAPERRMAETVDL
jgi:beta-aspartyl-peptidase (threonine type)